MTLKKSGLSFSLIDFDEDKNELTVRILSPSQGGKITTLSKRRITKAQLKTACDEYWAFVDFHVSSGVVTGENESARRAFLDDLMTRGASLTFQLLQSDGATRLWNLASNSEILVIATALLHIPWEALYHTHAAGAGFLSDCCVISRWPEDTGEARRGPDDQVPEFATPRIVCVDPLLADSLLVNETPIRKLLQSDGEQVYVTSQKGEMVNEVKAVRLVHWICEHAQSGLRVSSGVFYTADDSVVHRFAPGTILILTSCKSGGCSASAPSIAASISASSNCTVVAPSSLVAAEAGARFARKINEEIRAAGEPLTMAGLWKRLRTPLSDARKTANAVGEVKKPTSVAPEACFCLWYGIYGNGEVLVGS
jgi:hypothetical protein